jgi:hypothetical protein
MIIFQIANLLYNAAKVTPVNIWCISGFRADPVLSKQYDPQL